MLLFLAKRRACNCWKQASKAKAMKPMSTTMSLVRASAAISLNPSLSLRHDRTHQGVYISRQMEQVSVVVSKVHRYNLLFQFCVYTRYIILQCIRDLQQSEWLFLYDDLEFEKEVGSGAFGVVWKATARNIQDGAPSTIVAVKTLKGQYYYTTECRLKIIIGVLYSLLQ